MDSPASLDSQDYALKISERADQNTESMVSFTLKLSTNVVFFLIKLRLFQNSSFIDSVWP